MWQDISFVSEGDSWHAGGQITSVFCCGSWSHSEIQQSEGQWSQGWAKGPPILGLITHYERCSHPGAEMGLEKNGLSIFKYWYVEDKTWNVILPACILVSINTNQHLYRVKLTYYTNYSHAFCMKVAKMHIKVSRTGNYEKLLPVQYGFELVRSPRVQCSPGIPNKSSDLSDSLLFSQSPPPQLLLKVSTLLTSTQLRMWKTLLPLSENWILLPSAGKSLT